MKNEGGEAIRLFLPGTDRIIGECECQHITSLSRTSLWRLMKRGEFPRKVRIGPNRTGWKISAVLAWLETREAA